MSDPNKSEPRRGSGADDLEDAGSQGRDEDERDAGSDGEPAKRAASAGGDAGGEEDEQAARMARALGVGGDDEDEEGDAPDEAKKKEPPAPTNRAARRRDEAIQRRKGKKPGVSARPATAEGEDEGDLPRDKNARAKELLNRRREQAAERRAAVAAPQLEAGEIVDDAVARMTSAATKWLRRNLGAIQWVVAAAIVGTGGFLYYSSRVEKKAGAASNALATAVAAERGRVVAEDKRTDEEKEYDTARVYPSREHRAEDALANYARVVDEHPKTGAAILATLGQAGVLLEKREWDKALEAYRSVLATPLASADADVRGRAIEGSGFAKEGKGDADGALASFRELEGVSAKGFKELGQYHQARLLAKKGERDKAKELLLKVREKLQAPGEASAMPFLEAVVDEALRALDPSALPPRRGLSGPKGGALTQEELEKLLKKAREAAEKKQQAPSP